MLINIIGSGNVATHLAIPFAKAGHQIPCVLSRDITHAKRLAALVNATPTTSFANLPNADVTLVAVSDNSIPAVAKALAKTNVDSIIAHTSGATPIEALLPNARRAVFYPCQTFSTSDDVDVRQVPFLIEASDPDTLSAMSSLASSINAKALSANGHQRALLHVAAVFACNFPNHLLLAAQRLMTKANLPFETLRPLVEKTVEKAFRLGPLDAQTGPARRGDTETINRHEKLIDNNTEKDIYCALSNSILKTYHDSQS